MLLFRAQKTTPPEQQHPKVLFSNLLAQRTTLMLWLSDKSTSTEYALTLLQQHQLVKPDNSQKRMIAQYQGDLEVIRLAQEKLNPVSVISFPIEVEITFKALKKRFDKDSEMIKLFKGIKEDLVTYSYDIQRSSQETVVPARPSTGDEKYVTAVHQNVAHFERMRTQSPPVRPARAASPHPTSASISPDPTKSLVTYFQGGSPSLVTVEDTNWAVQNSATYRSTLPAQANYQSQSGNLTTRPQSPQIRGSRIPPAITVIPNSNAGNNKKPS